MRHAVHLDLKRRFFRVKAVIPEIALGASISDLTQRAKKSRTTGHIPEPTAAFRASRPHDVEQNQVNADRPPEDRTDRVSPPHCQANWNDNQHRKNQDVGQCSMAVEREMDLSRFKKLGNDESDSHRD